MVSLNAIRESDKSIASALPSGLVAVFVGATSGIGETSVKQFSKYAKEPRVYFIGRSRDAAERIKSELNVLNPGGSYTFIQSDISLLKNVDEVCREIMGKESVINLLFLTSGTLVSGTKTDEGLHLAVSVAYYSRVRFILNFLPLIQKAPSLRRVVTVFAAGKEGPMFPDNFPSYNLGLSSARGHMASMLTTSLEVIAKKAPEISFIHVYPGFVKSNLGREMKGPGWAILKAIFNVVSLFLSIPLEECGESQTFFSTSARFPPAIGGVDGVPLVKGVNVAVGTDGKAGSGVYSINFDGETSGFKVQELLAKFRKDGSLDKLWKHTEDEFMRVTGKVSI